MSYIVCCHASGTQRVTLAPPREVGKTREMEMHAGDQQPVGGDPVEDAPA